MCGITGILDRRQRLASDALRARARRMADTLATRGPDGAGVWHDANAGVALGHRRLAIIDCTPAGQQPMVSADGRWVISYNGEIYNYAELARDLHAEGHAITGGSDTAVLLEACAQWGVKAALKRCVGMFALALWDRRERTLWLARDRIGIKPVYWTKHPEFGFAFASQPKALRAGLGMAPAIDRRALASYLSLGYVPTPYSIHQGMAKLPPGTLMRVGPEGRSDPEPYWDLVETVRDGIARPFEGSYTEALDALDSLLKSAVRDRLVSDVPLGAFLSGGIDSSLVTALMQYTSTAPVRSFSIGFTESGFDESNAAAAVARSLGTDHTTLTATPEHARELIGDLPVAYDEPFADSSQIPTLLVSRLTRQHVTVALSGDGGDEGFAGYNRYLWLQRIQRATEWLPQPARRGLAGLLQGLPPGSWDRLAARAYPGKVPPQIGEKIHKAADALQAENLDQAYRRMVSQWPLGTRLVPSATPYPDPVADPAYAVQGLDAPGRMRLLDMASYLPDDILTKVDRASMAASLEARVPLLDHRVIAFAWRLPTNFLVDRRGGKRILRDLLARYVPEDLTDRPKSGFAVPVGDWLRGPLQSWAEALLDRDRLHDQGLIDPEPVHTAWQEHLSGRADRQHALWTVLMFQAWYATITEDPATSEATRAECTDHAVATAGTG